MPERAVKIDEREISGRWLVDPLTGTTTDELEDNVTVEPGTSTTVSLESDTAP